MIHFETFFFFGRKTLAFTLLTAISNVSYGEFFSCDTNILGLQLKLFSLLETGTVKCLAVLHLKTTTKRRNNSVIIRLVCNNFHFILFCTSIQISLHTSDNPNHQISFTIKNPSLVNSQKNTTQSFSHKIHLIWGFTWLKDKNKCNNAGGQNCWITFHPHMTVHLVS